jgi:hypothetical protein
MSGQPLKAATQTRGAEEIGMEIENSSFMPYLGEI